MFRFPANRIDKPAVVIEYDCRGRRTSKTFTDEFAARRFYATKLKSGCNPRVCKGGRYQPTSDQEQNETVFPIGGFSR
ncbi:hypothetical protein [Aeoliella sp.]|uniref:hypothetical protein n=1 Tax=Aeoliella sp. TaxID=2795800 RepID=UPI003CCB9B42